MQTTRIDSPYDQLGGEQASRRLVEHTGLLLSSYRRWTGRELLTAAQVGDAVAYALFEAPFAVVSHGAQPDPIFNYGNRQALQLFEMNWEQFTALPSRLSAEPGNQQERQQLLAQVHAQGYSDKYSGIRISRAGRRFTIRDATVWNVVDAAGQYHGQAAVIRDWQDCSD